MQAFARLTVGPEEVSDENHRSESYPSAGPCERRGFKSNSASVVFHFLPAGIEGSRISTVRLRPFSYLFDECLWRRTVWLNVRRVSTKLEKVLA